MMILLLPALPEQPVTGYATERARHRARLVSRRKRNSRRARLRLIRGLKALFRRRDHGQRQSALT